jgi:hypothetical protein
VVVPERAYVPVLLPEESVEHVGVGARRGEPVIVLLQVARVHLLLELMANGNAQDGLFQIDGLVDERKSSVGDDGARRGQVLHERLLGEVTQHAVALHRVAPEPVDDEAPIAQPIELGEQRLVARRRLVDEHVPAPRRLGLEDFAAQNRRHEGDAILELRANGRREERRDEVMIAPRQLRLHERTGRAVIGGHTFGDLARVLAFVDDLLVVDRHDRKLESSSEEKCVRVEVGENDLRLEVAHVVDVRRRILKEHRR